jgi:hypothetical protein
MTKVGSISECVCLELVFLVVSLVTGVVFGFFWRNRKQVNLSKVTSAVIAVLIFSLGFSIGANDALLDALPRVGVDAVVLLGFVLLFSAVFVLAAKRLVRLR